MNEKQKLLEIDIDIESLSKKAADAKKSLEFLKSEASFFQKAISEGNTIIDSYKTGLAAMEKQGKTNTERFRIMTKNLEASTKKQEENRQSLEVMNSNIRKQTIELRSAGQQIDAYNKVAGAEVKVIKDTDGSILQINAALQANIKQYKSLSAEQRANSAIGGELKRVINEQDSEFKELSKSIGINQVEVGNYKEQIKQALLETSGFTITLERQISQIPVVGRSLLALTETGRSYAQAQIAGALATGTSTTALKAFKIALISTGIGVILVALGSLVAFLASTQEGINNVNKVLVPLKTIFASLFGLVQDFGKSLFEAFSNPKKIIKELVDVLVQSAINKFKGLKQIITGIFTFDSKKIKEGFNTATQLEQQILGKVLSTGKAIADTIAEAAKRGARIAEIQRQLSASEADFITLQAQSREAFKEQNKIAEDQTKSLADREEAAKRAIEIIKAANEEVRKRNALEVEQLKLQQASNDTSDAERAELAKKVAEVVLANAQLLEEETTAQNKLNIIRKTANDQAIKIAKERIDAEIKASRVAIDRFVLENTSINSTLKERTDLIKTTLDKELKLLDDQLKAKQITQDEFELAQLEAKKDALQKTSEAVVANAEKELELFIAQNRSKIDNDTLLTGELVSSEQSRLQELFDRRMAILEEQRTSELISEQDFQIKKLESQFDFLQSQKELEDEFKLQKAEAEQLDFENDIEIRRLRGESEFQLKLEEIERQRIAEVEDARRRGADVTKVEDKFSEISKGIKEDEISFKRQLQADLFGDVAELLGKETIAGKAAGIAQATINTFQGVSEVWRSKSTLPEPFATAQKVISTGIVLKSGLSAVKEITKVKPPKAERGISFTIGGKRHSQGGTLFRGSDGSAFEAEKDERLFVLNRKSSAALAPLLSDINQAYGGVSLSNKSSYLAAGGEILRTAQQTQSTTIKVETQSIADTIGNKFVEAVSQLPPQFVSVTEISDVSRNLSKVVEGANI
jgi:hypothetical protein